MDRPGLPAVETATLPPLRHVNGKVAFITGGDSGIGLGIACACAAAGMKIVITYRSVAHRDEAVKQLNGFAVPVHAINVDVTDREAMKEAATETLAVFGKVHALINNAGIAVMLPLSDTSFDDWDWSLNVNVNGVFNGIRAFLPHIKAHGEGGQIVATSSMLGGMVAGPLWGAYSAAKFAVVGMMEALRGELAQTGIGVSIFCPAGVSSSLDDSRRNRPAALADVGQPSAEPLRLLQEMDVAIQRLFEERPGSQPLMEPLEAGERLLRGMRNNDLYIFSQPEFERLLRERTAALLASMPVDEIVSEERKALAKILHNSLYATELQRKRTGANANQIFNR